MKSKKGKKPLPKEPQPFKFDTLTSTISPPPSSLPVPAPPSSSPLILPSTDFPSLPPGPPLDEAGFIKVTKSSNRKKKGAKKEEDEEESKMPPPSSISSGAVGVKKEDKKKEAEKPERKVVPKGFEGAETDFPVFGKSNETKSGGQWELDLGKKEKKGKKEEKKKISYNDEEFPSL